MTPQMKYTSVYKWFARFKNGRDSLEDDTRVDRPLVITDALTTSVKNYVNGDRWRSVREIAEHVGTSYGTVRTILHEQLNTGRYCKKMTG